MPDDAAPAARPSSLAPVPDDAALLPPPPGVPVRAPDRRQSHRGLLLAAAGGAMALLIVLSVLGLRGISGTTPTALVLGEPRPLTSVPGVELFPALSPDGSMVAFSWSAASPPSEENPLDLYVMRTEEGSPVRLTSRPGAENFPSWSPDGTEIAFASESEGRHEICTVPVLGGSIRRMAEAESPIYGLSWSPDGRTIAYSAGSSPIGVPGIRLLSLADLSQRTITTPPPHGGGDLEPVWSPDGKHVAFIRVSQTQEKDAYIVPATGGVARQVEIDGARVSGVAWLSPRDVIVSAAQMSDYGLWSIRTRSGQRSRLSFPGGWMQRVSASREGRRLAYEKITYVRRIRCLDASPTGAFTRRAQPLMASTRRDSEPVFSPDGRAIAFISDRSGAPEIWVADSDGGNPRQLTDLRATRMTRPRFSPDGTRIAYTCNADGESSIYASEVESRTTRRLWTGGSELLSFWSRAHGDLVYQVDASSGWEVWRACPDGSDRRRISDAGYTVLDESADGNGLFCVRSGEPGIWLLPSEGGAASLVVAGELCRDWQEVVVAESGFYFFVRGKERSTLGLLPLGSARCDTLATLEWYAASPAISPDGSTILYDSIGDIEIDLMLAEAVAPRGPIGD